MPNFNKTKQLGTRVTPEFYQLFIEKASSLGKPSEVIRSLFIAFMKKPIPPKDTK